MNKSLQLRILFAGTPDFAVPALERLCRDFRPIAVLTQPDRPAGRGQRLTQGPVKVRALAEGIPVFQPESLEGAAQEWLAAQRPDLLAVVAYGLILSREVLAAPKFGCWNIHASLLPRWRGAAPIQRAIEAGDAETGVSIMQMDEGLDTGPVLKRRAERILATDTGGSLSDRLAQLGAELLAECIAELAAGHAPTPRPQSESGVSYARKLSKEEARIDWSEPARSLARRIRAFNPWPVCWCWLSGERVRVWAANALPDRTDAAPGSVLGSGPYGLDVATQDGVLRLEELQRPGGRRMSAAEFTRGQSRPISVTTDS